MLWMDLQNSAFYMIQSRMFVQFSQIFRIAKCDIVSKRNMEEAAKANGCVNDRI